MEIINVEFIRWNKLFQSLDNKIIFYDKISYLTSKDQITCGNIVTSKYYPKEEGTNTIIINEKML